MHDSELKELFERIEIAIAMQERMLFSNAERGDQTVDRFAYSATAAAQETIVSRRVARQLDATRLEYLQFNRCDPRDWWSPPRYERRAA